jgi:hypothetical protein
MWSPFRTSRASVITTPLWESQLNSHETSIPLLSRTSTHIPIKLSKGFYESFMVMATPTHVKGYSHVVVQTDSGNSQDLLTWGENSELEVHVIRVIPKSKKLLINTNWRSSFIATKTFPQTLWRGMQEL